MCAGIHLSTRTVSVDIYHDKYHNIFVGKYHDIYDFMIFSACEEYFGF